MPGCQLGKVATEYKIRQDMPGPVVAASAAQRAVAALGRHGSPIFKAKRHPECPTMSPAPA